MVKIRDVTLRDGQQSLLGGRMQQKDILKLAPHIAASGADMAEVWGGTCFEIPLTYKGEDPWENLRQIREAMQTKPEGASLFAPHKPQLSMLLRGQSLVSRQIQSDKTVDMFIHQAAVNGINNFRIFDALNDFDNMSRAIQAVRKAKEQWLPVTAEGTICYTPPVTLPDGSQIHTIDSMLELANKLHRVGVDSFCIKDMAGLLEPEAAKELISTLKKKYPSMPVTLHMHATMGRNQATLRAAVEAGVDAIDTSSEGLANGSGHTATEDILEWLEENHPDKAPDLNKEELAKTRDLLREIRPNYIQYESKYEPEIEALLRDAQVPGGMLTTMKANIRTAMGEKGLERFDEILRKTLKEMVVVRADIGYPPLVTPTSQIVMTQALNGVLRALAMPETASPETWRYTALTEDFAKLAQGHFGKLPGTVKQELNDKATKQGIFPIPEGKRPADLVEVNLEEKRLFLHEQLQFKDDQAVSDEDLLDYVLLPEKGPLPSQGLEFLKHKYGVAEKIFDAPAESEVLPDRELRASYGKSRIELVRPAALSYIDGMLHATVEKLRHSSKFILGDEADHARAIAKADGKIAALKAEMFGALSDAQFNRSSRLLVEQTLNALMEERGKTIGVSSSQLPLITYEEMKAVYPTTPWNGRIA